MVGFRERGELMRTRSMVGVLALVLAIAVIGAPTAFAQTPVVPATTVAPPSDDKSKAEKPKADKPKPAQPTAEQPTAQTPKAQKPKPEKPKPEKPEAQKPKPEKPKPEKPKPEKPTAEQPTAEQPTTEQPTATPRRPKPVQPKRVHANDQSAQPNESAREPQVEVTRTVSPRAEPAPSLAASGASAANPESSGTGSAGSGGDSAHAIPVASGPAAVALRREPRIANDDLTAAAAVPVERQQARLLARESLPGYNVPLLLLTLSLALVFTVGLGDYIRGELRGSPRTAVLRRRAPVRTLRRRRKFHAFSARVRYSVAAWPFGISASISTIAREHAMTKEKGFAQGLRDLRRYSRAKGAHVASSREAAYDRALRLRTTVGDRLRPLAAGRPSRRR
jgi:hypothetical protein